MVALGALLTPAAGLLALVAPSTDEPDNQCATLPKQARQPRAGALTPAGQKVYLPQMKATLLLFLPPGM